MTKETTDELLARTRDFVGNHLSSYLTSGGRQGHIIDCSHVGARGLMPTLLLETIGRTSGKPRIVPLIYGFYAGEWVVVGSKGGSPEHPAWFVNLQNQDEVVFQVATQAYRGVWRTPDADEHAQVWAYVTNIFPPYVEYQKTTHRQIPVVFLRATAEHPVFSPGR